MIILYYIERCILLILITGDLHGEIDVSKLTHKGAHRKALSRLTKDDYLIICGDFGFIWDGSATDRWWLKWLDSKPYTTLFIDGNHENHELLDNYPVRKWNGGDVHQIMPSVFHLMRGQVFTLQGMKFFTMGGAMSHDIECRVEGKSWWRRELPSLEEYKTAWRNLEDADWKVDYVISHSMPGWLLSELDMLDVYFPTELNNFFSTISEKLTFRRWYSGHYHVDGIAPAHRQYRFIYNDIVRVYPESERIAENTRQAV
ncbi:MAG: metallophosphoesterase [Oscillospiraceae bacterium]|nr:metallophosphoesterase [Oscillospiraceae bacterium]